MVTLAAANVEIRARFDKFDNDLRAGTQKALKNVEKDFDTSFKKISKDSAKELKKEISGVKLTPDIDMGPFERKFKEGVKRSVTGAENDASKSFKRIEQGLDSIGTKAFAVFKFAGIAGGISSLVAELSVLIGAAAQASGALLLLPAAAAGALSSFLVLKIGLFGLGDALRGLFAEDPKQFAEGFEKLSPVAREFVNEIKRVKPALDAFRKSIQDTLLGGFVDQVRALSASLLPTLQSGLVGTAAALNLAARSILTFLGTKAAVDSLSATFTNMKAVMVAFTPALAPLLQALLDLINVGMQVLAEKTGTATNAIVNFSANISKAAANGSLKKTILDAVVVFNQLARIAGNLIGVLRNVFGAAAGADGLLNNIESVTQKLDELTKSAEAQQKLKDIFKGLEVAGPILLGLSLLAGVFGTLTKLAAPFAAGLSAISAAAAAAEVPLAPLLLTIGAIAVALGLLVAGFIFAFNNIKPFHDAIVALGDAIAPIGKVLGEVFTDTILPALKAVGSAIKDQFGPIIARISQVISGTIVPAFKALSNAIQQNKIVFTVLGAIIGFVVRIVGTVLANVLGFLIKAILTVAGVIINVLVTAFNVVIRVVGAVFKAVVVVINFFKAIPGAITSAFNAVVSFFANLGSSIANAVAGVAAFFASAVATIFNVFQAVSAFIGGIFTAIFEFFTGSPEKVVAFITSVREAIINGLTTAVEFITGLPGKILAALLAAGNFLAEVATNIWNGFTNAISTAFNATVEFVKAIPGKIVSFIVSAGNFLAKVATDIWNGFFEAEKRGVETIFAFVKAIPGKIKGFFASAGNLLLQVGKDVINGLKNGIVSAANAVIDFVKGLGGSIVAAAKAGLGIKSPSKAMQLIGQDIGDGLILGMVDRFAAVNAAASLLGKEATVAVGETVFPNGVPTGGIRPPNLSNFSTPAGLRPAAATANVVQNIVVNLPTGDPMAAALAVSNRIAASVAS